MKNRVSRLVFFLLLGLFSSATVYAGCSGVLCAKGIVALQERKLLFDTMAMMLIVVLPVIFMSFAFAHIFKSGNKKKDYRPEWAHSTLLELLWWGIPTVLIVFLGIIVWKKSHSLDPYRRLPIAGKIERIEVVALRWKWLFIYPNEGIATINDLYLPVNQQVEFYITSDAPMSSFAIPQLGGQIYAMAGMRTRLHLFTTHTGLYDGLNTQINGEGFSYMHFPTHVVNASAFSSWIKKTQSSQNPLTLSRYAKLYQPDINMPAQHYSAAPTDLFNKIMMQYMMSQHWLHEKV